jgi:hypothetical protein
VADKGDQEWDLVTLRAVMDERDKRYGERFDAQMEALRVALQAMEKRLDAMNEIRGAMATQGAAMLPRAEYNARHDELINMVTADRSRLDKIEGSKGGVREWIGWAFAAAAIALQWFGRGH